MTTAHAETARAYGSSDLIKNRNSGVSSGLGIGINMFIP